MKKTFLALATIVLLGGTVSAQTTQTNEKPASVSSKEDHRKSVTPEERAKQATDQLNQKVSLTKEQSAKAYEIELTYIKQRMAMHNEKEHTDADKAKMNEIHKTKQESIKALLTPEQFKKLEEDNRAVRSNKEGFKEKEHENHTK